MRPAVALSADTEKAKRATPEKVAINSAALRTFLLPNLRQIRRGLSARLDITGIQLQGTKYVAVAVGAQ